MMKNNNSSVSVVLASLDDSEEIHRVLKSNLIEIENVDEISQDIKMKYENRGFLRKEVNIDYYKDIISNPESEIFIAKKDDRLVGFATLHKNKSNVKEFRSTLDNLYLNDEKTKKILLEKSKLFDYLDQISILPEFQRKGIASQLFQKIISTSKLPIVSFIVETPLANKASAKWHEMMGFKLNATCDGSYKGKKFKWGIYIYWNESN